MLSDKERIELLETASEEIENICRKYGVRLTVTNGGFWVHHGEWHENTGDYSVREIRLDKCCNL